METLKKIALALLMGFSTLLAYSQTFEYVEDANFSTYEGASYKYSGAVTVDSGFDFNPYTEGESFYIMPATDFGPIITDFNWDLNKCGDSLMASSSGNCYFNNVNTMSIGAYSNQGLSFDGVNSHAFIQYPFVGNFMIFMKDVFSFTFWIKGSQQNSTIISQYDDRGEKAFKIYTRNDSIGILIAHDSLNTIDSTKNYLSSIPVLDGNWHHVAMLYHNDSIQIFVDSVLDSSPNKITNGAVPDMYQTSMYKVMIACNSDSDTVANRFTGMLDEVQFFQREISENKIYNLAGINYDPGCCIYFNSENLDDEQEIGLDGSLVSKFYAGSVRGLPFNIVGDETINLSGIDEDESESELDSLFGSTKIQFDIHDNCTVDSFRVHITEMGLDTIMDLEEQYYSVIDSNYVSFMVEELIEEIQEDTVYADSIIIGFEVNLEDGVLMTPNGDGAYDTLIFSGLEVYSTISISITDIEEKEVFTSTNSTKKWDGKIEDSVDDWAEEGTYLISAVLDGTTYNKQILLKY